MRTYRLISIPALVLSGALFASEQPRDVIYPHARMKPTLAKAVQLTGGFWKQRSDHALAVTLPSMWNVMQKPDNGAYVPNLSAVAAGGNAKFAGRNWSDGDVFKWLEAAAHFQAVRPSPELDRQMDDLIAIIAKAQAPDGYLSTQIQLTDKKRWSNDLNHELYNMGHLLMAACVHHRATGKHSLLAVARKLADHIELTFHDSPRPLVHFGYSPSHIMGLVELYRVTGEKRYLKLASHFVDVRGTAPGGSDHTQTRIPLRKETMAAGHAVVGTYFWAGAADVFAEAGDFGAFNALGRIWNDLNLRKVYVTGGSAGMLMGITRNRDETHEAFSHPYNLHNRWGYNETCANIGHALWNWRMLMASGDAKFMDQMEIILYNSMLSGIGLNGKSYFYSNPLRRFSEGAPLQNRENAVPFGQEMYQRWESAGGFCCPPNILRMIASMQEYAYGVSDKTLWVNLYGSNSLSTPIPKAGNVKLTQQSEYPWDGRVSIRLTDVAGEREFAIRLRIPSWADRAAVRVGGSAMPAPKAGEYAEIRRRWNNGDTIELDLGLKARLVESNPLVEETRNQVAVARGPVVYCLESADLPAGVDLMRVSIPVGIQLKPRHDSGLLSGVTVLEGTAVLENSPAWGDALYRTMAVSRRGGLAARLIPYYAWANRGKTSMTVWMPIAR